MIDPSTLVDPGEVADIIGLGNVRGVAVYRKRYEDFPTPIIERGRCLLWQRSEVEDWARKTGRLK
jgi:predicted DNA-binding transcriptional regulator AlpA